MEAIPRTSIFSFCVPIIVYQLLCTKKTTDYYIPIITDQSSV